jgi:hypothetical protein
VVAESKKRRQIGVRVPNGKKTFQKTFCRRKIQLRRLVRQVTPEKTEVWLRPKFLNCLEACDQTLLRPQRIVRHEVRIRGKQDAQGRFAG